MVPPILGNLQWWSGSRNSEASAYLAWLAVPRQWKFIFSPKGNISVFLEEDQHVFRGWGSKTGWWFGTFFIFPYIGNNHPNWLIFFRGVQTTNQKKVRFLVEFEPGSTLVESPGSTLVDFFAKVLMLGWRVFQGPKTSSRLVRKGVCKSMDSSWFIITLSIWPQVDENAPFPGNPPYEMAMTRMADNPHNLRRFHPPFFRSKNPFQTFFEEVPPPSSFGSPGPPANRRSRLYPLFRCNHGHGLACLKGGHCYVHPETQKEAMTGPMWPGKAGWIWGDQNGAKKTMAIDHSC